MRMNTDEYVALRKIFHDNYLQYYLTTEFCYSYMSEGLLQHLNVLSVE